MNEQDDLIVGLAGFSSDPLGFVYFSFPWGVPGSELEKFPEGPEPWQIEILLDLQAGIISASEAVQLARTSGHGIGKSALVSWIILWAISTFEDTKGVVTANTETQLKTKTWAELAKWYRLFIGRSLFQMTATALFSVDPDHEKTWRIDMVPWSERNPEAFAGLHNQGKRILVVFDEASAIVDMIWETTEGALTDRDTQIIWCVFGNPTKNKGRFRDCFPGGRFAHRWHAKTIDSRTVAFTDKALFARWVNDYGEDSDFVRVRVRGVFPRTDAVSFISYEMASTATLRELPPTNDWDLVIGVDVGRFGDDPSVIYPRRGPDARSILPEILPGLSTVQLSHKVVLTARRLRAVLVFIDEGGVGGGVVDLTRVLAPDLTIIGVDFGSAPSGVDFSGDKYANERAEVWGLMKKDVDRNLCLPVGVKYGDVTLEDELSGPTYGLNGREEIQLESKKDMRRRKVPSPNIADALACTYALPTAAPQPAEVRMFFRLDAPVIMPDYDPYSPERMLQ